MVCSRLLSAMHYKSLGLENRIPPEEQTILAKLRSVSLPIRGLSGAAPSASCEIPDLTAPNLCPNSRGSFCVWREMIGMFEYLWAHAPCVFWLFGACEQSLFSHFITIAQYCLIPSLGEQALGKLQRESGNKATG